MGVACTLEEKMAARSAQLQHATACTALATGYRGRKGRARKAKWESWGELSTTELVCLCLPNSTCRLFLCPLLGPLIVLLLLLSLFRSLLRSNEVQRDPRQYEQVVQKVIAYMTLGVDVSGLFSEMIMVSRAERGCVPGSSTIFVLQLLIASHKQFGGGLGGRTSCSFSI